MKKKKNSIKINIMLLSGCKFKNRDSYIEAYDYENILYENDTEKYFLYKFDNPVRKPDWLKMFEDYIWSGIGDLSIFKDFGNTCYQGLTLVKEILHKEKSYLFAINFGNGRHNINRNHIEDTFGMYTAIAKLKTNKNAKMHRTGVRNASANPRNSEIQLAQGISVEEFVKGLDDNDIVRNINVRVDKDEMSEIRSMMGKYGSLTIKIKFNNNKKSGLEHINDILEELIDDYESILNNEEAINKYFKNLRPVPKNKQAELYNHLIKKFYEKSIGLFLFEPEIDFDISLISSIKYILHDQKDLPLEDTQFEKLDIEDYKKLRKIHKSNNSDFIKEDEVWLLNDNGKAEKKWTVYNCLYGEVEIKDHNDVYILSNKVWYSLSKSKFNIINSSINEIVDEYNVDSLDEIIQNAEIEIADIQDKNNRIQRENIFNRQLCKHLPGGILFDEIKQQISIEGDKIEVCDVYYPENKEFIHTKIGSKAANLNHLFVQGYTSAWAFACHKSTFTDEVNKKIKEKRYKLENTPDSHRNYKITYLILNDKVVNRLTFLTKLTLYNSINQLRGFGYIVKLSWIKIRLYPFNHKKKNIV